MPCSVLNSFFNSFIYIDFISHRLVPEYKQKVAGKSLPFEKYAVYKANKYAKKNHRLILAGLVRNPLPVFISSFL